MSDIDVPTKGQAVSMWQPMATTKINFPMYQETAVTHNRLNDVTLVQDFSTLYENLRAKYPSWDDTTDRQLVETEFLNEVGIIEDNGATLEFTNTSGSVKTLNRSTFAGEEGLWGATNDYKLDIKLGGVRAGDVIQIKFECARTSGSNTRLASINSVIDGSVYSSEIVDFTGTYTSLTEVTMIPLLVKPYMMGTDGEFQVQLRGIRTAFTKITVRINDPSVRLATFDAMEYRVGKGYALTDSTNYSIAANGLVPDHKHSDLDLNWEIIENGTGHISYNHNNPYKASIGYDAGSGNYSDEIKIKLWFDDPAKWSGTRMQLWFAAVSTTSADTSGAEKIRSYVIKPDGSTVVPHSTEFPLNSYVTFDGRDEFGVGSTSIHPDGSIIIALKQMRNALKTFSFLVTNVS